ncbi:MAG TPA: hypothetical protein VFB27_05920 [Opitutaceae bacterium]|nr:hypothetical protein [Opitutaceae bacterium]
MRSPAVTEIAVSVPDVTDFVCRSVAAADEVAEPFFHLEFSRVFPDEIYARMLAAMPTAADYRPMSGRSKSAQAGGRPTRVKTDLLPEYIRHLPMEKQPIWSVVGRALCSPELKAVFRRKLAPGLRRRFGDRFDRTGLYPMPILTRDIAGYSIPPHTDTHWKGITVQFYLPPDDSVSHIGTVFNKRQPDGGFHKHSQMRFVPNTGYAFAVGTDTWHSVETVGPEVATRDSILLTYFVDASPLLFLRNRVRRFGNMLRHEWNQRNRN